MAVASRQPQTLTPPGSVHGGGAAWDFAVPLAHEQQKPSMSEDDSSLPPNPSSRQPLNVQPNGASKQPHSPPFEGRALNYEDDQGYLAPTRVNDLQRKGSDMSSKSSSDPDGVLDYYKAQPDTRKRTRSTSQHRKMDRKKANTAPKWVEDEMNDANWIHRDKLAQIESKELEAAGFRVGRGSRSNSRSASATRTSRSRKNSEARDGIHPGDDLHEKHRMVSPIPAEDEEGDNQVENWDLRTPEEIAAEREAQARQHVVRPSTSRIPLAPGVISRIPVPKSPALSHAVLDRDGSQPRSRKGSSAWNGDPVSINGTRMRSGSIGSQVLLDDTDSPKDRTPPRVSPTSPKNGSPQKARMPTKTAPASGNRKPSGTRNTSQPRPRNTSTTTSPVKRPGTSGGLTSRPTTGHRPEGEAPWIATMYKPDPRLPPEQQIIPTHAKRMQQMQWENEGKVGSIYDREFKLLNTDEFKKPEKKAPSQEPSPVEQNEKKENQQWPLPSPTKAAVKPAAKPVPPPINTTIKVPSNDQGGPGGYKLTPTVPLSPRGPKGPAITRVPDALEGGKEKKGCGMCISDGEEPTSPIEAAGGEVEVSADASAGKGQMSVLEALKGVLKLALIHDGLARGLREASKALDRRQAHMCVLNEACEEEAYKKLVVALCSEHKIPLIKVPDGKQLGEWAGLCQIDREGNPRKVVNCSCVVVKDWGEESQERSILLNYFQTEQ
ncbi:hypothetical protein GQ43DRAFT_449796 [Delitschia confertaspora ATCC 74209]|uniref:40S ribosomal protein S12 n=1 Tax=Delitschia confertaspora ATCC 74209 TaxID=1513339 RepID=A0A9P4JMX5_9PLEO|nr:hypothetical protein GQ43DRAFT_449796 [Delitschia confertaspora ATCC 74209]